MASFFPLIQDLLPMIMPSSVHVVKGGDLVAVPVDGVPGLPEVASADPPGVVRKDAIVDKTDKMCATVLITKPQSSSAVHHHGEQDAIIYVAAGSGFLLTKPAGSDDAEATRHSLGSGDFAVVPAWTEHQSLNEATSEDLVWIVIRSGPQPLEVALTDWGGPQVKRVKPKPSPNT